jgi:hypothetical protein
MLPPQFLIDYESFIAIAQNSDDLARFLIEELPFKWRDLYIANTQHPTNIQRVHLGTFEYFYDFYSELEAQGEVPHSDTIEDRLVGVIGRSAPTRVRRDPSRLRGWVGPTEKYIGTERDKGHFIAHCIGGGLDVNVFSQLRSVNRGWSKEGKVYRHMEDYCYEHAGTLCFSRPVYIDETSVPRWLEFGVMRQDGGLWVERFDNGTSDYRTARARS